MSGETAAARVKRSESTNTTKKKKLHLFQRHGSPTWRKRPMSEVYHSGSSSADTSRSVNGSLKLSRTSLPTDVAESPVEICTEPETWKLHHFSSREVAEELCLMDGEVLRKINPEELDNGAWMKKEVSQHSHMCMYAISLLVHVGERERESLQASRSRT